MAAPPPLSKESAERMKKVVSLADDLVDAGGEPNVSIAKAAREFGLPVGHVPIIVRAFNTGRSVRQQGASDPWEKAAAHPIADIDLVVRELTRRDLPQPKSAADTDYLLPPAPKPKASLPSLLTPDQQVKLAAERDSAKAAAELRTSAKKASAPVKQADNRVNLEMAVAAIFDHAVDVAASLKPSQYHAAKKAATRMAPDASSFFFSIVEGSIPDRTGDAGDVPYNRSIFKSASVTVTPDPTIRTDHPLVRALVEMETAKKAYVVPGPEPVPDGFERVSGYGGVTWLRKQAVCPIFGTIIPPASEPAAPAVQPSPGGFDMQVPDLVKMAAAGSSPVLGRGLTDWANLDPKGMSSFGKGFQRSFAGPMSFMLGNSYLGKAVDLAPEDPEKIESRAVGDLGRDLGRVDRQSMVQDLLADPRFIKADPKILMDTYRDLASLAPRVMANRSVAADFLQRRLTTGPLSYWDLEKLTAMEKNIASTQRPDTE